MNLALRKLPVLLRYPAGSPEKPLELSKILGESQRDEVDFI
jgi:hypothetical protein